MKADSGDGLIARRGVHVEGAGVYRKIVSAKGDVMDVSRGRINEFPVDRKAVDIVRNKVDLGDCTGRPIRINEAPIASEAPVAIARGLRVV